MTYLIITLLVLNLLGVLYVLSKVSSLKKEAPDQELNQKLIENMIKVKREVMDVKTSLEQHHRLVLEEISHLKEDIRSIEVELPAQAEEEQEQLFLHERYQDVFALYKQGLTTAEIAKKLEKGNGEVELILQLAGKKGERR